MNFFYAILAWAIIGGGIYWYYTSSQETIAGLNRNLATAIDAATQCETTLEQKIEDIRKEELANKNLDRRLKESEKDKVQLQRILKEHDLTKLAMAKPGLIESRINEAVKRSNEEISDLTNN